LTAAGSEHLAHDHFGNLIGLQLGASEQLANHGSAQFRRRNFREAAAEFADGGPRCGDDDDVGHWVLHKRIDATTGLQDSEPDNIASILTQESSRRISIRKQRPILARQKCAPQATCSET
jgi:hypothetical protein